MNIMLVTGEKEKGLCSLYEQSMYKNKPYVSSTKILWMKIVIQRVSSASIMINNTISRSIDKGYVILLGVEQSDTAEDVDWLVGKVTNLRVFSDTDGKMNLSIMEVSGSILVVSQFTLHASTKKGNRPSFIRAARPDTAIPLYERFIDKLKSQSISTATGEFGADMQVSLTNDGPVTIIIDSKNKV